MAGRWPRPTSGQRDDGAAAVEFALLLVPLLAILFGMIDYSWYFYTAQSTSSAAREGARRLVVGDCQGPGQLQNYVAAVADTNALTATYSPNPLPPVGDTVTVTVTANGALIGFVPLPTDQISGVEGRVRRVVQARVEDLTPSGSPC